MRSTIGAWVPYLKHNNGLWKNDQVQKLVHNNPTAY